MKLSDTALIVLNSAAARDDRLVPRRGSVPPVADVNTCRALVKQGLVEVVRSPLGATDIVTVREDEHPMAFVIADAGFRALNLDPPGSAETAGTDAATEPHSRCSLALRTPQAWRWALRRWYAEGCGSIPTRALANSCSRRICTGCFRSIPNWRSS